MMKTNHDKYIMINKADLDEFSNWYLESKLSINVKKSKAILFGTRGIHQTAHLYDIDLHGETLHYVKDFNYLTKECLTFLSH